MEEDFRHDEKMPALLGPPLSGFSSGLVFCCKEDLRSIKNCALQEKPARCRPTVGVGAGSEWRLLCGPRG